jgi:hypothetical protein
LAGMPKLPPPLVVRRTRIDIMVAQADAFGDEFSFGRALARPPNDQSSGIDG